MSIPLKSFTNLPANTTTAAFVLPAGAGELQFNPVNRDDPGVLTLRDTTNSTDIGVLYTPRGEFPPGFGFGSLRFQTLGGSFSVNVTKDTQNVTIYFDEG